jgi:PAS domain S-box-containing protein
MSRVQIEACPVSVDAALIADGLGIEPALVQPLMREGQITSMCEHGLDRDAGRYRLTFFHGNQRFGLVIDAAGNILERSTGKGVSREVDHMTVETRPDLARAMIEQAADAIIFADTLGVIQIWNQAAAVTFGFESAEAIGQSLDLIVPEHLRPAHWHGFHRAMDAGHTRLAGRPVITRALHKNGQRLYVEMSFAVVRAPTGTIAGSVAVARDATSRVEQEKLQRERSRPGEHSAMPKPPSA